MPKQSVIIVGAGIIGLSCAWRLARTGVKVTLISDGNNTASTIAAGMLAPYSEMEFDNQDLCKLGIESLKSYPSFLKELVKDVGSAPALHNFGTLLCAMDSHDENHYRRFYTLWGRSASYLERDEILKKEPLISPRIKSAIFLKEEAWINPTTLLKCLRKATKKYNISILQDHVVAVEEECVFLKGEKTLKADYIVVCAGAQMKKLMIDSDIRPQKGQILTLKSPLDTTLHHMLRTPRTYLSPTESTQVRLGATVEEVGGDCNPTIEGLYTMLRYARELLPSIDLWTFQHIDVAHRPASYNHRPIIGPCPQSKIILAGGHRRSGILLAPITAQAITHYVKKGLWEKNMESYLPKNPLKERQDVESRN